MRYNWMNFLKSIAILIFVSACSTKSNKIAVISDYAEVHADLCDFAINDNLLFPTDLIIQSDSILTVYEAKNTSSFLNTYNTNTLELISAKGDIGDGPKDFINPRILHDLTTDGSFYIGDVKKICAFPIDSLSQEYYTGSIIQSIPPEMMYYNYILIDRDSIIVYSQTGEHPISIFNRQNLKLSFTDYFPDIDWGEGSPYILNMDVFANSMTSNGENVAIAYRNWNAVSLITPEGEIISEVYLPDWGYNRNKMRLDSSANLTFEEDAKIFFTKIKSNDKYIFALGWADTKEHIKNNIASSFIYMIDWEGNIIKKINFDKGVSNFCINGDSVPYVIAMGEDGELHVYQCIIE